jgi:hypothetical protein
MVDELGILPSYCKNCKQECEDCIHEDVCKIRHFPSMFGLTGNGCPDFKNKADVVEVVRCKDCAHWGGVTYGFVCRKFSGLETKICMGADHYCSYGERSKK